MQTVRGQSAPPPPPKGGEFLLRQAEPEPTLIPEDLDAEARLIGQTMRDFVRREVLPLADRLEAQEPGLMRSLVKKAGELGLLAANIPECYGGLNLPKSVAALLTEESAVHPGFALSIGVHSGVATLPLLLFGTQDQKAHYLPMLATGEMIGAFALSEANSGSDALAAECRATLSPDGKHYLLNGTKFWITNAAFADLFTVFAKVDGEQFTAFLVERDFPGVSIGPEEHKMGLKSSSTCRVLLENAQVPVGNVLGEVGKGGRVALYSLNPGRFSIGASALGMGKENLRIATQYAMQRVQFGKPIIEHGLIQQKLAEMAVRLFALESMIYRVAGWWDALLHEVDTSTDEGVAALRSAFEEYAIECAIIKVYGTETLDYIVDESLQIHGGFGYSEEFPAARAYRDARVYRIFEGTNEINRLTVADQLRRRIQNGRLDGAELTAAGQTVLNNPPAPSQTSSPFRDSPNIAEIVFGITCLALSSLGPQNQSLVDQIVSAEIANLCTACFALDSAHHRKARLEETTNRSAASYALLASNQIELNALRTILSSDSAVNHRKGENGRRLLHVSLDLLKHCIEFSSVVIHDLARAIREREGYPF